MPLKFNKLCLWSSPLTVFHYFFYARALFAWDPSIGLHRFNSFLCQNFFCVHVAKECRSLLLYLFVQQLLLLLYFFSFGSGDFCALAFFSCVLECTPTFLALPPSVASATFRLHISACRDQIWYSCCLSCVVKFTFVVVSSVNAASLVAVYDTKFIKTSYISPCLNFFVLPYPAAPAFCSSSSPSRYYSWKCALKRTHMHSFAKTNPCTVRMCVLLWCQYMGNTHVWELAVGEGPINCDREFLSGLNII